MLISEIQALLEELKLEHGDLPVSVEYLDGFFVSNLKTVILSFIQLIR